MIDEEAELEARFLDCLAVARNFLARPDGRELAVRTMAQAEETAVEVRHWGELAKCWARSFQDFDESRRCFDRAVGQTASGNSVATVDYRIREADDNGRVVRHVIGYRMVPTEVYIPALLAAIFFDPDHPGQAADLMAKAEQEAESHSSSMRNFKQFDQKTLLYFDRAGAQLCWLYIAHCWARELGQIDEAVRCARKAEEIADELAGIPTWVSVASFWMNDAGGEEEARRCIAEAEKKIRDGNAGDYMVLARGIATLGDPDLPVQYLDKAELAIEELSDWDAVRLVWEELGYLERAERAQKIADYLDTKVTMEEYLASGGGHGRYVPGEGPY